jgi:galactokinase
MRAPSGPMSEPVWLHHRPRERLVSQVMDGYRRAFGTEPDGVWSAPGRVNLIGEHTDYNGGPCLPLALPYRTVVAAGRTDDGALQLRSAQAPQEPYDGTLAEVRPGGPTGWAAYVAGVPWALGLVSGEGEVAAPTFGLRAYVDSDVPSGAGLSSSAALSCSAALAVDDIAGLGLAVDDRGRALLAGAGVRAENEVAGAPTGGMDQSAALRCTAGHALLVGGRPTPDPAAPTGSVRQVPFDPTGHGLTLLVIDTQARHALVDGQYARRRATCEHAAELLGVPVLADVADQPLPRVLQSLPDDEMRRRVRHVVSEVIRVQRVVALLEEGRVDEIGPLLTASHLSLRDDYEVSCRELDLAVKSALGAGALGARMTGGGFGGSALALVASGQVTDLVRAVVRAFDAAALRPPRFARAVPSDGGSRWA